MRDIKFRAWYKKKNWMYENNTLFTRIREINCDDGLIYMQYTGLKDKNGVEIYEGDIIKEGCNGLISEVVWDNELGTYKLGGLGDYFIKDVICEWEVIGNIYENPELLN